MKCAICKQEKTSGYKTDSGFHCTSCEHKTALWANKNFRTPINALNEREAQKITLEKDYTYQFTIGLI